MNETIKRGDVYYADLSPVVGSEQDGTRPVLIVSNDVGNKYSPTIVVVPITSRGMTKKRLPTHVLIQKPDLMTIGSVVLTEQIRAIDKCRLKDFVCELPSEIMSKVGTTILISLSLKKDFR